MSSGLSRLIHDLLQWATREFGVLHIDPAFLQISSIMPQKRNPVVLEHLRARVGWVLGDAHTAATLVHSAALGDTVDVEDEFYEPLFRTFEHGLGVLRLLDAALGTCQFDVELLRDRASTGFTTATELADTLVRRAGLPFRQAHRVASTVVQMSGADSARVTVELVAEAARQALGRDIQLDPEVLRAALDPWCFVEQRTIAGRAGAGGNGVAPGQTAAAPGSRHRLARRAPGAHRGSAGRARAPRRHAAVGAGSAFGRSWRLVPGEPFRVPGPPPPAPAPGPQRGEGCGARGRPRPPRGLGLGGGAGRVPFPF